MKYLYYSLYQVYTKIFKVQRDFAPVINIAGVLAMLQVAIIFSIANTFIFIQNGKEVVPNYPVWFQLLIAMVLYVMNERYYRKKEPEILTNIGVKAKSIKWIILICSFLVIILILWLWMGDGLYRIICFFLGREPNLFN
ncbi:MAG: hypothetical protein MI974_11920 [Chitinophagales bacterium]|nr:hypothetical protein [Chitinophagales bacterium]